MPFLMQELADIQNKNLFCQGIRSTNSNNRKCQHDFAAPDRINVDADR
jgi:hypothetical protein